jgi:endonuclease III
MPNRVRTPRTTTAAAVAAATTITTTTTTITAAGRKRARIELALESTPAAPAPVPVPVVKQDDAPATPTKPAVPLSPSSASSPPRKKSPVKLGLGQPVPLRSPPAQWAATLAAIRLMRRAEPAPVDTVGCAQLASTTEGDKVFRFQTLVALMLSSQTKDPVTAQAMHRLRAHGLTVPNILATPPAVLDDLIGKVGFHNRKTVYVRTRGQGGQ